MPKPGLQLRELSSPPVAWLSDGMLKISLLLRHETLGTPKTEEAAKYLLKEKPSPEQILGAFPKLRNPGRELLIRASDDYLRCLLAKSISEVYRKITPKYRNEAARKQFFKRIALLTEAVHLTSTVEQLHNILDGSTNEEAEIWVATEFEKLVRQRADLSNEYHTKLNASRSEFTSSLKQLEELVGVSWPETERYRGSLRITSLFPIALFENESTWTWGSQWYPEYRILNLNPPVMFDDLLRRGVLARDAGILLSPRNLDTLPRQLYEQSEYLAYKLFERKYDKEFWAEARHGLRKSTRLWAHELIDFFLFREMMVGDGLYREVWLRLKELKESKLTSADYFTIFSSLASRPITPIFDEQELNLLKLLSRRPEVGAGEAARLLSVSIPTAMKAIRFLSTKAGLSFTIIVDMERIGLTEYLVPIRSIKQGKVVSILARFPYCRQVFRTYGSYDLFTVVDIPQDHEGFAASFFEGMTQRQIVKDFKLLKLQKDLHAVSFDAYDAKKRHWDIHWDSWGIALRDQLSKLDAAHVGHESRSTRPKVDKLDLNILSSLQSNCRTPFSSIARSLGVSGAYVGRRVAKMSADGIFRYAIWPLKIGAEDWGLVALSCSDIVANSLAQSLSKLPAWRGGLVTADMDGLLSIVWCPNGELKQLFKAIDDRLLRTDQAHAECLDSIGEWLLARWLPIDPDDPWKVFTDDGKWLFDEQRFMNLIS